jgi:single stranded DNA-binding protein
MNEIQVTLRGNVATDPRYFQFADGNAVTSFRLASTSRWFDRERGEWVKRETTYLSVNCRRWLADNSYASLMKGQPVVVTGRLRERFWEAEGRRGHTLELEALTVGHDLSYGEAKYSRVVRSEPGAADPEGDALTAQVMQDAPSEDRARRLIDVSGLPTVEDDDPKPDDPKPEEDDEPDDPFEEFTLAQAASA